MPANNTLLLLSTAARRVQARGGVLTAHAEMLRETIQRDGESASTSAQLELVYQEIHEQTELLKELIQVSGI